MAVYEALLLNTVVPQIQAAQAGDSYVMVVNATTPALRITQTGTGDSILVEDAANPDSSPFVVTAAGDVGIGTNAPAYKLDVNGNAQVGNATAATNRFLYINGVVNKASAIGFQESGVNRWLIGNGAASENGNFEIYDATNANNFVLTRSGNLGLGVTPSAWGGAFKALDIGSNACVSGTTSTQIFNNAYDSGSGFVYKSTSFAQRYQQNDLGQHIWYTAPSGTAGNAISFTQALTLTAAANLLLGGTSDPGGEKALYIANTSSVPGTPTAGGVLYVEAGALKYKGSSGTVTTLANA